MTPYFSKGSTFLLRTFRIRTFLSALCLPQKLPTKHENFQLKSKTNYNRDRTIENAAMALLLIIAITETFLKKQLKKLGLKIELTSQK